MYVKIVICETVLITLQGLPIEIRLSNDARKSVSLPRATTIRSTFFQSAISRDLFQLFYKGWPLNSQLVIELAEIGNVRQ